MLLKATICTVITITSLMAGWVSFDGTSVPTAPTINIISGSREGLTLKISLHGMLVEDTTVNGITYQTLSIPKCAQISDIGKPMLPYINKMIGIHPKRQVRLLADSLEFIVLDNYYVFPAQYSQNDSVYQVFPFAIDDTLYSHNIFYPGIISERKRPAIFRDLRVADLSLFPIFFNPQTHQLKVLKKVILSADFTGTDSINTLPNWPTSVTSLYGNIYRSTILNYNTLGIPDELFWTRPRYLIISDGSFAEALNPFIFWKTKKGLEIFLETINNPEQRDTMYIKDLITSYYNNYNISYVLLVGDGYEYDQPGYPPLLPIANGWVHYGYTGYSISDYWYSTIAGDDDIADIALGRFSVWTNEQLNRVTEKLFSFERSPNAGEWFIKRNILVSHKEEWRQYHECKTESIVPIITLYGFRYYDDWGGYAGMSNEVVKLHINDPSSPSTQKGASLLNYRGHGLVKEWQDWCYVPPTSFTNDDIYSLTNFVSSNNAWLPIVFENSCCCGRIGRTSPLSDTTGHSECWFRHQRGGGVAALGAARPTATFHNHKFDTELYRVPFGDQNNPPITQELGWVINNAKVNMAEAYGWDDDALNIVRTNNLVGDPEIDIYTGWNGYMTVWHEAVTYSGPQEFFVDVYSGDIPLVDAIVCLYKEGDVFETRPTNTDGRAVFYISPHPGTMHVTVTKHDFGPYEGTCLVMGEDTGSEGQSELISYPFSLNHTSYSPRTRSVNISYQLPEASFVEIAVFDVTGKLVNVIEKDQKAKGTNCEVWDCRAESGKRISNGIHFIRLKTAKKVAIKKVVIY